MACKQHTCPRGLTFSKASKLWLAAAVAAAALVALFAAPASAAPAEVHAAAAGPYYIYTGLSPYHQLDANPGTMHDNGGKVWQWDYNSSIQQRWWLFEDKTIRPAGDTTMCLDANPNTNYIGGTIYLWKCNGSAQQIWYRTGAAGYQNGYSLRCLDANPNTNWNGGTIYQWDCNNSAQQRWTPFS